MRPGQYLHLLEPSLPGLLRPVLPVAGFDRIGGALDVFVDEPSPQPGLRELERAREGDVARFAGPLGRGFEVDPRSRHLLLVADEAGLARVRSLVEESLAAGRVVTVLLGAASVARVFPASLLPDEVEYVVATHDGSLGHHGPVTDLVTTYEAWADQCFAAGSGELTATMVTLARGRDQRMGVARLGPKRRRPPVRGSAESRRKAWLQLALGHDVGCALGVCLGCVIDGDEGEVRVCREGPAFASDELRGSDV